MRPRWVLPPLPDLPALAPLPPLPRLDPLPPLSPLPLLPPLAALPPLPPLGPLPPLHTLPSLEARLLEAVTEETDPDELLPSDTGSGDYRSAPISIRKPS